MRFALLPPPRPSRRCLQECTSFHFCGGFQGLWSLPAGLISHAGGQAGVSMIRKELE